MSPIPLSPIDHIFTGAGSYPIEFVFAYKEQIDAERLLNSLRQVLASFQPAKSQITNDNGRFFFKETEPGFSFEVVESELSFEETFSQYRDYESNVSFESVKAQLTEEIIEDITEDIFNRAFVNW